jgi:predicted Rossmann-fold nucleotide-binding protein
MKSIAVFCGCSSSHNERYIQSAYQTGNTLAAQGIQLVYGGACVGLMGAFADGALRAGGHVIYGS